MIKGTNRRMFRRPRPAREASGILASSQELINQVLPLRMNSGGDPFAELKKLIEAQSAETKEPGFRELIRSLGVGALQSEFADPSRGTVENFARALPFALESVDKKRDEARAQALALAQARGKIASEERSLQAAQQLAAQRDLTMTNELIRNKFGSDKLTDFLRSTGVSFGINEKGVPVAQFNGKQATNPVELKKLLPQNTLKTFDALAEGSPGGLSIMDRLRSDKSDTSLPFVERIDAMTQFVKDVSGGGKNEARAARSRQFLELQKFPEFVASGGKDVEMAMKGAPSGDTKTTAKFLKGVLNNDRINVVDRLGVFALNDPVTNEPTILFMEMGASEGFGQVFGRLTLDQFEKLSANERETIELNFPGTTARVKALETP